MSEAQDIMNIIEMLDDKMSSGVSRLKINVEDDVKDGEVKEQYHMGRCDVGSPYANGTVGNGCG
ncbi:MAG: hypothetical protein IJ079_00750 [Lachnospiraceae bacterium]|nr:hypothetical protein [Lachnospiraceae bacterium]MBR1568030.1 hypothetical protein [Lachnospiraceae bacterium]MBR1568166.1 hypothetical protein [Lachnospiraceae bacterium]